MRNICKRITTLLLAVCMLLTVLPPLGGSSQVSAASLPSSNLDLEPEVAAYNAITDVYYTFAASSEVNGHDYLYLALRGGVLVVYDVDDKKVMDTEPLPGSLPRGFYIDEDGIVWICGYAGLFRYDPVKLEGTMHSLPSDFEGVTATYGVTGDGNGNIYFGTGHSSYLGMYNTATGTYTNISGLLDSDVKHTGYAGICYKDGYLYLGIDGDSNGDGITTHDIIKYDIRNQSIVSRLDISYYVGDVKYLYNLNLVDDVLFASFNSESGSFYVDISTMEYKSFNNASSLQHAGEVSEVVDDKVYFRGRLGTTFGYIAYDIANETFTQLSSTDKNNKPPALNLATGNLVTVDGNTKSIMVPINDTTNNCIDLYFYNLSTKTATTLKGELDVSDNIEAGYGLRAPTLDPTGQYIYVGAGSNSLISKYSVAEGKVVESFDSFDYQTDSILYHGGYLYTGNYSAATITKIDPITHETTPLFTLRYSVFNQCRMWCTTFGGNKVFAGTTPYSGFGGMLVWYDFDNGRTYVAAGPEATDVYYAENTILTDTNYKDVKYTWYNADGDEVEFDPDEDGNYNVTFSGPIENQVINNLIYKKDASGHEYLYGTTAAHGSSESGYCSENAVLFVYDLTNTTLLAKYDVESALEFNKGKTAADKTLIGFIDQLAEDPDVPGLFWGAVSGTLFTMTFDVDTKAFTVTEKQSFLKDVYSAPGMVFSSRDIIFDGPYMYVAFNKNTVGTYMFLKDDPTQYRRISTRSLNQMVLAADGNLYGTTNESSVGPNDLHKFSIAEYRDYDHIATVSGTNGISYCYNNAQLASALSVTGNTVTLTQNVTVSDVIMAEGVVLDLNGCTLSGVLDTAQGTVKDSSEDSSGWIEEKPINTAPGQVALKDKDSDGYRVVTCTVTIDGNTEVRNNDTHFWYHIAFSNEDAYALAKADSSFTLGANVIVDGKSAYMEFEDVFVTEWANAMVSHNGAVTIHICIRDGAKISMSLTPTVSKVERSSAIVHTPIEGYSFTVNIPELDNPLSCSVAIVEHTPES